MLFAPKTSLPTRVRAEPGGNVGLAPGVERFWVHRVVKNMRMGAGVQLEKRHKERGPPRSCGSQESVRPC